MQANKMVFSPDARHTGTDDIRSRWMGITNWLSVAMKQSTTLRLLTGLQLRGSMDLVIRFGGAVVNGEQASIVPTRD